jgi:endoglucanase
LKELIRSLVEAFGPSGHEDGVRSVISSHIEKHCDSMSVDTMGNLIAVKKSGAENAPKIMVAAHMDEIGAMVSYIDEKGFVRIASLGGVFPMYEVGGRLRFENGSVGVISMEKRDNPGASPHLNHLYVDVGAKDRASCPVKIGDAANFLQPMVEMGECIAAKAMDDRIGCAVMVQTMLEMQDSPNDIYYVFTTQEEVGLRGVTTGAFGIDPDVGIALDVTFSADTPKPSMKMAVALGDGPAVKVKDSGMLATPWVKDWMIDTAQRESIPYQREVLTGGATDAAAIQKSRAGVPAGCISIPCRYVHSPSETVNYDDVLNAVKLLKGMLQTTPPERG